MSLRAPHLALFLVGCGASTATAPAIEPPEAEACIIEPSGAWTAPHANMHTVNGALVFEAYGAGLWRMTDGAPERLLADSTLLPGGRWRPTHVAWAEGWWAALNEEGQLVRGPLEPSVEVPPLTLPACAWLRGETDRRGSIARFSNGDWLLGCDRQIVIADTAGNESSRFARTPFTAGELPLEVDGRRLVVAWGTHHGVAAFDAASGRMVWRSELRRTTITLAVSREAPQVLVTHFENEGGRIVEGGRAGLFGLDPQTGGVVWELRYPGPWPRAGVDPRNASQLVPRWIDARHLSLEARRLVDWEPVSGREIQRLALGDGASPPTPDGPALPLDELYGAAIVLPDGASFGILGGVYVERGPEGELRSEFAISEAGGARRWPDGRVVCPEDACPWARPCEAR